MSTVATTNGRSAEATSTAFVAKTGVPESNTRSSYRFTVSGRTSELKKSVLRKEQTTEPMKPSLRNTGAMRAKPCVPPTSFRGGESVTCLDERASICVR